MIHLNTDLSFKINEEKKRAMPHLQTLRSMSKDIAANPIGEDSKAEDKPSKWIASSSRLAHFHRDFIKAKRNNDSYKSWICLINVALALLKELDLDGVKKPNPADIIMKRCIYGEEDWIQCSSTSLWLKKPTYLVEPNQWVGRRLLPKSNLKRKIQGRLSLQQSIGRIYFTAVSTNTPSPVAWIRLS
ncbi:hypothetical protein PIIN_11180 [Serendipita indica DSM 11827]|uniref:Uncharacterized protein n=1 Tax=Serendipita indica (strain DSM 11827) TaxID=1109443 RepID=G4U0V5_SERID|nr:hypothetical protein PIIN_11180 [Serendipita indica DSM 11827]